MDEIEHVVPGLSPESHWVQDYVHLWKALRAIQTQCSRLSLIVAGVNASAVESSTMGGFDNPLFQFVKVRYVTPLDRAEIRDMVRTLGRYMGLQFEEAAFDYLLERYGGHALLTRQACSFARDAIGNVRLPYRFVPSELMLGQDARERRMFALAENILDVLSKWYPDEWDMLCTLASGDTAFFLEASSREPRWIEHLVQYGLVAEQPLRLRIPMLASYLRKNGASPV